MIDEKFIQSQKKIIEKDIKRLESEIKENRKYLDLGTTNEDNALEFEALEEKQAFVKTAEKDLGELRNALKRAEAGKYGLCLKCGKPIEIGRLKAYPAASCCVTHAK